eukprot:6185009-Pleurochrysis_carterae.AAC.4
MQDFKAAADSADAKFWCATTAYTGSACNSLAFHEGCLSTLDFAFLCIDLNDDPLPSFEKRQTIATRLGMTPRSVQIWFQNRRQRLLKPLRQGDSGELDLTYDGAREGSFTTNSDCGDCHTSMDENGSYMMDDHDQQHRSPGSSPSTVLKQFSSDSSLGSTGSTASAHSGLHLSQAGLNLPAMPHQQQQSDGSSSQPNLLMMFQKALVDRQLPPGVAVLLAQALQTQISGSAPSVSDPQQPFQQHAPQQQPYCFSREASTSQSSDSSALPHSTPSIARRASPPTVRFHFAPQPCRYLRTDPSPDPYSL